MRVGQAESKSIKIYWVFKGGRNIVREASESAEQAYDRGWEESGEASVIASAKQKEKRSGETASREMEKWRADRQGEERRSCWKTNKRVLIECFFNVFLFKNNLKF